MTGDLLSVTDQTFDAEVLQSDKPVLVDFTASWCGPCKALAPVLESIAADRRDVKFVKIDVGGDKGTGQETNPVTRGAYDIQVFPTLFLLRGGKVAGVRFGGDSQENITAWIDRTIAKPAESDMDTAEAVDFAREEHNRLQQEMAERVRQKVNTFNRKATMLSSALKIAGAFTLATVDPVTATALLGGLVMGESTLNFQKAWSDKPQLFSEPTLLNRGLKAVFNAATLASGVLLLTTPASGALLGAAAMAFGGYMAIRGGLGMIGSTFNLLRGNPNGNKQAEPVKLLPAPDCNDGACALPEQAPPPPRA